MSCHEARELFSANADELLAPDQRLALDRHLQGCAECAREWDRFRRTVSLLRSVEEARAPAGFARRVIEAAAREPWPRRLLRGIFLPLHVKLPLEAAAVVLVSTLVILIYRQTPELQRAAEGPRAPAVTAPAPAPPPSRVAESEDVQRSRGPAEPKVAPPAVEPASKQAEADGGLAPEVAKEKDRLETKKQEEALTEAPAVGGRMDVPRQARKPATPAAEPELAARAQGPFHLVARLRPRSPDTLDSQLNDLVKQVGGILVRDAERVGRGSIVEVVVSRDAYPRLEAGLRQLGDFTVETRAPTLPDQVRVAVRIAD